MLTRDHQEVGPQGGAQLSKLLKLDECSMQYMVHSSAPVKHLIEFLIQSQNCSLERPAVSLVKLCERYIILDHLRGHRNRGETPHQVLHVLMNDAIHDLLKSLKIFHKETGSERVDKYDFFAERVTEPVW